MPRANSPFLTSISGSLRGGPTFRATSQTPDIVMQTRPVPTDHRTAKQAAVRDAYSRLAWLWKNLSHLDKEPYEIMAERRNLTPWNCWLSFHLPLMRLTPKFYTVFAEGAGSTVQDFAIGGEPGTINGAIFDEKNNLPCLSFDKIDDFVAFDRLNYYDTSNDLTLFLILDIPTPWIEACYIIGNRQTGVNPAGLAFWMNPSRFISFNNSDGIASSTTNSGNQFSWDALNVIAVRKNGLNISFYINGNWSERTTTLQTIGQSPLTWYLGRSAYNTFIFGGRMHLAAKFDTPLSNTSIESLDSIYRPFFT